MKIARGWGFRIVSTTISIPRSQSRPWSQLTIPILDLKSRLEKTCNNTGIAGSTECPGLENALNDPGITDFIGSLDWKIPKSQIWSKVLTKMITISILGPWINLDPLSLKMIFIWHLGGGGKNIFGPHVGHREP